jgi:hypothetical protein
MRFTLYNILYKRILVIWIFSAFVILLGILFGNKSPGLVLFGLGVAWLILNAAAIFLCMWVKLKVYCTAKILKKIWESKAARRLR